MSTKPLVTLLVLLPALAACTAPADRIQVDSDYNTAVDFSTFRTYAWDLQQVADVPGRPAASSGILHDRIRAEVDNGLAARGLQLANRREADLLVNHHLSIEDKVSVPVDPYYAFYEVEQYAEGTLVIDVVETRTKKLVWRGTAQSRLADSSTPEERQQRVGEVVAAILERYPPGGARVAPQPVELQPAQPEPASPAPAQLAAAEPGPPAARPQPQATPPADPDVVGIPLAPAVTAATVAGAAATPANDQEPAAAAVEAPSAPAVRDLTQIQETGATLALWKDPKFQRQFTGELPGRDRGRAAHHAARARGHAGGDGADGRRRARRGAAPAQREPRPRLERDLRLPRREPCTSRPRTCVRRPTRTRRRSRSSPSSGAPGTTSGSSACARTTYAGAAEAFSREIQLGGGTSVTYGLLGFALSNLGNDLSAESAYRMAMMLDPETLDWKMHLARSFFMQRRFADAVALADELVADDPDNPELWAMQGKAYIGLGEPLKAAQNFEIADRLGGADADTLNTLADIYVNEGLYELGVDMYIRAMELEPAKSPDRPLRASRVLASLGAGDEVRNLTQAIRDVHGDRLSEEDRIAMLKLEVRIAAVEGASDEEARVLEEIVALDPLDGEALILLGRHHAGQDDPERRDLLLRARRQPRGPRVRGQAGPRTAARAPGSLHRGATAPAPRERPEAAREPRAVPRAGRTGRAEPLAERVRQVRTGQATAARPF